MSTNYYGPISIFPFLQDFLSFLPFRKYYYDGPRGQISKTKIIGIIRLTPGGHHAWCESSAGIIRKPISSIPIELR